MPLRSEIQNNGSIINSKASTHMQTAKMTYCQQ